MGAGENASCAFRQQALRELLVVEQLYFSVLFKAAAQRSCRGHGNKHAPWLRAHCGIELGNFGSTKHDAV